MNQYFKEELIKQVFLIAAGLALVVLMVVTQGFKVSDLFFNFTSILITLDVFFLPLSIAYAGREVAHLTGKMIRKIASAGRDYYIGNWDYMFYACMRWGLKVGLSVFAVLIAFAIGWILGIYRAVLRLKATYNAE